MFRLSKINVNIIIVCLLFLLSLLLITIAKPETQLNSFTIRKLQQADMLVYSINTGGFGSGTYIEYKGKKYILTVAHLFDSKEDLVTIIDNREDKDVFTRHKEVKIIKINVGIDLALLESKVSLELPYISLASREAKENEIVFAIGNFCDLDDAIICGYVERNAGNYFVMSNSIYFGCSGGAVVNSNGELVGVVSNLYALLRKRALSTRNVRVVRSGAVRLSVIKKFLEDVQ